MCFNPPPVFQQSQKQLRRHHMVRCAQHMVSVTTRLQPRFWRSSVQQLLCGQNVSMSRVKGMKILQILYPFYTLCHMDALRLRWLGWVSAHVITVMWVRGSGLKVRFSAKSFNYHYSLFIYLQCGIMETESNLNVCSLISCHASY